MAKVREGAAKGRIIRKMSKDEYVSFDRSAPIRRAIYKEGIEEPVG